MAGFAPGCCAVLKSTIYFDEFQINDCEHTPCVKTVLSVIIYKTFEYFHGTRKKQMTQSMKKVNVLKK